jgi:hypothetical protein
LTEAKCIELIASIRSGHIRFEVLPQQEITEHRAKAIELGAVLKSRKGRSDVGKKRRNKGTTKANDDASEAEAEENSSSDEESNPSLRNDGSDEESQENSESEVTDDGIANESGSEGSDHHPPTTVGEEMEDPASDEAVENGEAVDRTQSMETADD